MRRVKVAALGTWFGVLCIAVTVSGCGGRKGPIEPTPPPELGLTCPPHIDATANDGVEADVTFEAAPKGGTPPITVECSPTAGGFPVGETHVVCQARDAASHTASCDFLVVVVVPPKLAVTRFDAFGDSITEGVVSLAPTLLSRLAMPDAYPAKLEALLASRYTGQTFSVINRGIGGERLETGRKRLPGVLDEDHPEVLLLLEGINNIRNVSIDQLAADLDAMVVSSRRRGVQVMLVTLLPVSSSREERQPGTMADIRAFNGEIARIADKYRTGPVVDMFSVFSASPSLIGADGLHPTADGYTRMAEVFFDAIRSRYEEASPPPANIPAGSLVSTAPAVRTVDVRARRGTAGAAPAAARRSATLETSRHVSARRQFETH